MILETFVLGGIVLVMIALFFSFYIGIFGGAPFVPTPMKAVHKILKNAGIKKGDKVYDIGAGDGRLVHFASRDYHAQAVGFEIDPFVYFFAKMRQWFWNWEGKMVRGNFTKHDLSSANIIVCYMLPGPLAKFQKKFDRELKKGTKIISYSFSIGDWKPKKIVPKEKGVSRIFIYEV